MSRTAIWGVKQNSLITQMCAELIHLINFCFLQKHIMIHKGTKKEDTNYLFLLLIIIANQIMTFVEFPSLPILPHEFNHSLILLNCVRTQTAKRPLHLSTLRKSPTQKVWGKASGMWTCHGYNLFASKWFMRKLEQVLGLWANTSY